MGSEAGTHSPVLACRRGVQYSRYHDTTLTSTPHPRPRLSYTVHTPRVAHDHTSMHPPVSVWPQVHTHPRRSHLRTLIRNTDTTE